MRRLKRILDESKFELIGGELYLKDFDNHVGDSVSDILQEAQVTFSRRHPSTKDLQDRIYDLYSKLNRLMDYLGLEDVVIPETKAVRVRKQTKVRANTKPKRKLAHNPPKEAEEI